MLRSALLVLLMVVGCGGGQQVRPVVGRCDNGHPDVCRDLAARQESGVDGAPDPARATELYRLAAEGYLAACQRDDGLACAQLAQLYRNGRGVVHSGSEAAELEQRACSLGVMRLCK